MIALSALAQWSRQPTGRQYRQAENSLFETTGFFVFWASHQPQLCYVRRVS